MFKRLAYAALVSGMSLSATTVTAAETTPVFKAPIGSEAHKSKQFVVNRELGRAWVEIDVRHPHSETDETYRVQIPGLSYDETNSQVVYASGGQTFVCADVRETGTWIFRSHRVEATGDCELTRSYVEVPIDDGFAVDVVEHFEVHLKPARRSDS